MLIKIKTAASKNVSPDFMKITINLKSFFNKKEEAINDVLKNYSLIKDFLKEEGNIKEELKTVSYKISEHFNREYFIDLENGNEIRKYKDVFDGYIVNQIVEVSAPIDVLFATKLITSKTVENKLNITINYYLKDAKKWQEGVIVEALCEAEKKALVIAKQFNKSDVSCKIADYTYSPFNEYSRNSVVLNKSCIMGNIEDIAKTLEPVDITITENIYSEWEF